MAYFINLNNLAFPGQFEFPAGEWEKLYQGMLAATKDMDFFKSGLSMLSGIRFDPAIFPKRPRAQFKTKKLCDFVNTRFGWIVSRRAIDLIEGYEPGVHQYVPVELEQKDGSPWPVPYWMFNMCTHLDTAVDESLSNLIRGFRDKPFWYYDFPAGVRPVITVRREVIAQHGFWWDVRIPYGMFVSDSFWTAIETSGTKELSRNSLKPHFDEI